MRLTLIKRYGNNSNILGICLSFKVASQQHLLMSSRLYLLKINIGFQLSDTR